MELSENKSNTKIIAGVVSVIAVIGVLFGLTKMKDATVATQPTTTNENGNDTSRVSTATQENMTYKDGTYNAEGSYKTPGGMESVAVNLTLKNGIVTSVSASAEAKAPVSKQFQAMFINGVQPYVVGKSIDSLNLKKVSGSSLTPKGFNDAIAKIKLNAKA